MPKREIAWKRGGEIRKCVLISETDRDQRDEGNQSNTPTHTHLHVRLLSQTHTHTHTSILYIHINTNLSLDVMKLLGADKRRTMDSGRKHKQI